MDLFDGLDSLAHPSMGSGIPKPRSRAIRIDPQCNFEALDGRVEVLVQVRCDMALNRKCHRLPGAALDRPRSEMISLRRVVSGIDRPALPDPQHMPVGLPGKPHRIMRFTLDRRLEQWPS